ncbi:MAG: OB-fold domain-containing protein [Mycobacteriaceae bacterium]
MENLSAPLDIAFDYTRSLGTTLGPFMTALREHRIIGARSSSGTVYVPPAEYDPRTAEPLTNFVDVASTGTVLSWSWNPHPDDGQPLTHPFAWALVRLDGADTAMLHAVDVTAPEHMTTGMRVRARWAVETVGRIHDIACFEPEDAAASSGGTDPGTREVEQLEDDVEPVTMVTTPFALSLMHSASAEESAYLRALAEGRVIGQRCPVCTKVYIPPRGACPTDGVPTTDEVELSDTGTVTTFCIVNVPFAGQRIQPPYVAAYVLLDGADIAFLHLILGCSADEVHMGMRVRAQWKPREEWGYTLENIEHFAPNGEPDAPYESYSHHL